MRKVTATTEGRVDPHLTHEGHGPGCQDCVRHGRPQRWRDGARPVAPTVERTHGAHALNLQQAALDAAAARHARTARRRHAWLAAAIGFVVGPVLAVVSQAGGSPLVLMALPAVAWAWSPGARHPVRDGLLIVGVGTVMFLLTLYGALGMPGFPLH